MRQPPGAVLALVLLLAGCTSESAGERADDPAPSGTPASDVIALVSESAVGGRVSPEAAPLDSPTAIADFSARFEDERMGASISAALAGTGVPDGLTAVGAVVAIGCEPPTDVEVETGPEGVRISAAPVKSDRQCLVPITTVALVAVSSEAVSPGASGR